DLREGGLVSLPLLVRAGVDADLPRRMNAHVGALIQSRLCTELSDHLRRREAAGLDVARQADADIATLRAQPLLLGAEAMVVQHGQRAVERRLVVAAVVLE